MIPTHVSMRRLSSVSGSLVDRHVGIIREVKEVPRECGAPDFFHFASTACNTMAFARQANFGAAGGASSDRSVAIAKAIGEAIERYCSAIFQLEDLPLSSAANAPFLCVPPDRFALYSESQYAASWFPWVQFDANTPIRWTPAIDPLTGERHHVPASMVYLPYSYYQGTGDAPIVQPISTGLACHCSYNEAAISGGCEVIERDAFMITWQAKLSPPQIRVETLSDENYDLVQRFERVSGIVNLLDITTDAGIPTVLATLRCDSPTAPPLVVAASTAMRTETAIRKSLEELAHTRRYCQQIKSNMPRLVPDDDFANVCDQVSHLNFWCDDKHLKMADFLFASSRRKTCDELINEYDSDSSVELECLSQKLRAAGSQLLIADVTTPDVRELGLSVVRALIPGFHPLFMGYRLRSLGGERLWDVPGRLGYRNITKSTGDNAVPHPYP